MTTYDPNDIARTTIKETTLDSEHDGHISGPKKLTIHDPNDIAKTTIKETTIECDYESNVLGPKKMTTYANDVEKFPIDKNVTMIAIIIPAIPK